MRSIRRRLGVLAAVVALAQAVVVGVAGPACCCASGAREAADEADCCPAGMHAPGRCPMRASPHRQASAGAPACQLRCSSADFSHFLLPAGAPVEPSPVMPALAASPADLPRPAVPPIAPDHRQQSPPPRA